MKHVFRILFAFLISCNELQSQDLVRMSKMMESLEANADFNGVLLIAKGDSILLHEGYGYSDRKKLIPTDLNTVFNIASVTKGFTAVAVFKLAEEGMINLQDPISKYFTEVPQDKAAITISQLLAHHSGLPQTYAAEGSSDQGKAANKVLKLKLETEVGSKFIYSNGNYTLLALIIEKVTQKCWEDYIEKTILSPLGMKSTYFWATRKQINNPEASPIKKTTRKRDYGFLGSTGIFSTASDLLTFQKAIKTNIILSDSSKAKLLQKVTIMKSPLPNSNDYAGYGFFQTVGETNSIWLRGNEENWGVSISHWLPEHNLSIIVLSTKETLVSGEKPHLFISNYIIKGLASKPTVK